MTNRLRDENFYSAQEEIRARATTAYDRSSAYELSFLDHEFLLRRDLRPLRLQLELMKAELIQQEHNIRATIVVFGSARALPPDEAQQNFAECESLKQRDPNNGEIDLQWRRAKRQLELSAYYDDARAFAKIVTEHNHTHPHREMAIVTGGGPGIMEAANRGAHDVGGRSIGLNIILPHEQQPNPYITPELCFQFHYFALRKMHFMMRAKALVAFPGGFGTLDELFETLTLVQTGKARRVPILLYGSAFWRKLVDFDYLYETGCISAEDLKLFHYVDSPEEAWQRISEFFALLDEDDWV
ncbi:MAG TPA: TIGR00730 family Rossman fold protein [Spongiibacteraceae bacterium]|nr:TIGR00730 family Rossman fold protein [Spongiibacteraceae bacterium]